MHELEKEIELPVCPLQAGLPLVLHNDIVDTSQVS